MFGIWECSPFENVSSVSFGMSLAPVGVCVK